MELNLAGINELNLTNLQDPNLDIPELDLTGIDKILSKAKPKNEDRIVFQPENADWSIARLSSIEDYYLKTFSKPLPVSNIGQGKIHNKWNYDHRASVDIGINPSSNEGKKLISYLRDNNIPFLAFNKAIQGVATGPHIHVGRPSHKLNQDFPIGETEQELNLTGLEEVLSPDINLTSAETAGTFQQELDITGVGNIQAPLDLTFALDPKKIDFQVDTERVPGILEFATRYNKPVSIAQNPNELGPIVKTIIDNPNNEKPNSKQLTDAWLQAWNPEYKTLNDKFREETGGLDIAIVDSRKNYNFLPNNKIEIQSRPTRGIKALFEAYKNGGLREFNATNMLINQQLIEAYNQQAEIGDNIKKYEKEHPYLSAIESGFQSTAQQITQLSNNIKYLGKAVATGNYYGYNSKEYLDLINKEREEQETIAELGGTIYRPPSFIGKVITGAVEGITSLPLYVAVGEVAGPAGLPVMAYVENLHRGNRKASLEALKMALLMGVGRGVGKFTDRGTLVNENIIDVDGVARNITREVDIGMGSKAPFTFPSRIADKFTKENLSLFQNTIIKGESVSIAQLSPLERQLVHRGLNALALQLPVDGVEWSDIAANIVVGLGFPVGKSPGKVELGTRISPHIAPETVSALQLKQPTIDVPLTKYYGKVLENETRLVPLTDPLAPQLEKGFIASGQAETVHLDLDTANLNLLELKRALEEHTYRNKGDDLKTGLQKQQAIKNAINILEKAIPEQTKEFFKENEKVIREALKTNYEARIGKENFLKKREESLKPNDIKVIEPETPKVNNLKQTSREIFSGKAGDENVFTSQDKAAEILKDFFKITTQGTLKSSLLPYGDVLTKKSQDLAYLGAFYIEDFYRRGIEPTIDIVLNKIKGSLGDYGRYISDAQAKNLFEEGMNYYNSNVADPFFSKMKMDATEKLPNKFNVEQARNILSQHENEFEWTSGLEDFLKANEGKKINKQDLIDVINKGQVRVEENIGSQPDLTRISTLNKKIINLEKQLDILDKDLENASDEQISEMMRLEEQKELLQEERDSLKVDTTKYSLSSYSTEKLELAGAKNSKEVKLISVTEPIESQRLAELQSKYGSGEPLTPEEIKTVQRLALVSYDTGLDVKYKSPHWDEGNVVAHYRANDRASTDNKRIYFGEEFQSDWNHDIREYGLKHNERDIRNYAEQNVHERPSKYIKNQATEFFVQAPNAERFYEALGVTREQAIELYVEHMLENRKGIEPNPFMQHNWKELVLKRFLRDAVVAKDENGNYKYDAIGWTTARQQLERYGGILEGKEFKWTKNSDGTYTFDFKRSTPEFGTLNEQWERPHELTNISLERFEELTTKEAADFVREQENKTFEYNKKIAKENDLSVTEFELESSFINYRQEYKGQFSLSETVELRSREGTYADYDVAYKNILSKIGKRFEAKYSEREIPTETKLEIKKTGDFNDPVWEVREIENSSYKKWFATKEGAENYITQNGTKIEKIHSLEITPSMRQSLEKEGFPLYGTGGLDPLKNPEVGIRNVLTTREAFNQHRDFLIKSLEETLPKEETLFSPEEVNKYNKAILEANKEDLDNMQRLIEERKGTIFNSGLSPDAFIDQAKLLYRGIQDFTEFTKVLVERFGDQVKPFLQDLWMQVKDIAKAFHEDERGMLNLQFRRMKTEAEKKYRESHKKDFYYDNYSIHRGIMLAQTDPAAGIVYDVIRIGQRDKNSFEYKVLQDLRSANKSAKKGTEQAVADNILIGNENQKLYTNAELVAGDASIGRPPLNPDQIQAYKDAYKAEHRNLDKRLQQVLFGYRERVDRLNNRLASTTAGTPQHTNILNQILDIADAMKKVTDHYQHLKDTGYISLKRKGPIAAFVQDPAFPIGDKRGEVYRQFNNIKEAGIWVAEQEKLLKANPANSNIYDINIPQRLRAAAAKLTPAQFEDLIDSSGINPKSPEIESLRDEIYSRFPSKGYELKRDYVRGYDRNWQFVLESIADQTEVYANSFYSRVAGEHAIKALEATGLQQDNIDLYKTMQKFIDHEISSPERTKSSQFFTTARKGVYLFHLGFDINQLYLNAIAQPITQTYSYFARVSHNGKMLGPFEAEKYWIEGWTLAGKVAKKAVTGKGNVPVEFDNIRNRLIAEGVITPEFNKSLLESEAEKGVTSKLNKKSVIREIEHWAGVFMRAGEKTTRTHAAAEAYLVGKNKFGLVGEDLVNFMVRSIDATQTNPSRAEAPLLVRGSQNQAEIRKLLYQFNAFNHMWVENLALNVKSDFQNRRISATSRHLIPLAIMGGITGLPLAGLMGALYTLITNKDPKDEFHKYVNNQPLLERLALYGVTGNATLSQKLVPTFPFSESIKIEDTLSDTLKETASTSAIPAFSTAGQIVKGFDDLRAGDYLRAAGSLLPTKPLRNAATVLRYKKEGIKTRKDTTIVPKSKVTSSQLLQQGLGIPPSAVTEYYNEIARKKRTKRVKKLRKILL